MKPIEVMNTLKESEEFEKALDELGVKTVDALYYVTGTPEDCHTIEDADKYYDSLPSYSSTNYKKDKGDITPEQYKYIDEHRKEAHKSLSDFVDKICSYGPLD